MNPDAEKTRQFYESIHSDPTTAMNWGIMAQALFHEKSLIIINRKDETIFNSETKLIESLRAAEFFPDETPPRMLIAESADEDHDDLRKKYPSKAVRISGDVIKLSKSDRRMFVLDPVINNEDNLLTKTRLSEVLEMLLDMGFVPVNAQLEVIFTDMTLPHNIKETGDLLRKKYGE